MLQFPPAWPVHFGADLASAFPAELGARFRYHERLRPEPSFRTIVGEVLARDEDFAVREVGEMARIVTGEGEYGAWVALAGEHLGAAARRFVGAAFLGEFATCLDVLAIAPAHSAAVERLSLELTRAQRFELGQRPRRFFYQPPPTWQAVPSGLVASWYPLDFPANASTIVVPPASVIAGDPAIAIEDTFAGAAAGLEIETRSRGEVTAASGVKGAHLRLTGRRDDRLQHREVVIYAVAPHAYRMRLETTNAAQLGALRETFLAVARSFWPLPDAEEARIGNAFAARSEAFDHWAT